MIKNFKNYTKPQILSINKKDIDDILELADEIFKGQLDDNKGYLMASTNWDISIKLELNKKIIGFYLFNDNDIYSNKDIFKNKKGIEGVALGIEKKYRGKGFGNLLIDKSYELFKDKYDYIWGQHLKTLNNLENWKTKRTIIDNGSPVFLSYKFLK